MRRRPGSAAAKPFSPCSSPTPRWVALALIPWSPRRNLTHHAQTAHGVVFSAVGEPVLAAKHPPEIQRAMAEVGPPLASCVLFRASIGGQTPAAPAEGGLPLAPPRRGTSSLLGAARRPSPGSCRVGAGFPPSGTGDDLGVHGEWPPALAVPRIRRRPRRLPGGGTAVGSAKPPDGRANFERVGPEGHEGTGIRSARACVVRPRAEGSVSQGSLPAIV